MTQTVSLSTSAERPALGAILNRAMARHAGCTDAVNCDHCMRSVARYLAWEMEWQREAAAKTAESYREDLGVDICEIGRARELRLMTMLACGPKRDVWFGQETRTMLSWRSESPRLPDPQHESPAEVWAARLLLLFIVAIAAVLFYFGGSALLDPYLYP